MEENAVSIDWSPPTRRQKDLDARWIKKHGKSYFGYRLSVNVDKRRKLTRKIKISTASQHDTLHFEDVLDSAYTSRDIYADNGCINFMREERLASKGCRMHTQRKGSQDKPLSEAQQRRYRRIASARARVEHVLAGMAQLGGKMLCLIGLARAHTASELEGRQLQPTLPFLPEGGEFFGVLTPEVRPNLPQNGFG